MANHFILVANVSGLIRGTSLTVNSCFNPEHLVGVVGCVEVDLGGKTLASGSLRHTCENHAARTARVGLGQHTVFVKGGGGYTAGCTVNALSIDSDLHAESEQLTGLVESLTNEDGSKLALEIWRK